MKLAFLFDERKLTLKNRLPHLHSMSTCTPAHVFSQNQFQSHASIFIPTSNSVSVRELSHVFVGVIHLTLFYSVL